MTQVYLFDWGNTLTVDFPEVSGKMCNWQVVEAVSGAKEALENLSKTSKIYIATGAADSTEVEIQMAFERVGLNQYISGYFCKENVGISKGSTKFLESIINKLTVPLSSIVMVGDDLVKDILPALAVGIQPIWLTDSEALAPDNVVVIRTLKALCE